MVTKTCRCGKPIVLFRLHPRGGPMTAAKLQGYIRLHLLSAIATLVACEKLPCAKEEQVCRRYPVIVVVNKVPVVNWVENCSCPDGGANAHEPTGGR